SARFSGASSCGSTSPRHSPHGARPAVFTPRGKLRARPPGPSAKTGVLLSRSARAASRADRDGLTGHERACSTAGQEDAPAGRRPDPRSGGTLQLAVDRRTGRLPDAALALLT